MERGCALAVPCLDGAFELRHIRRDDVGVESKLVAHRDDRFTADRLVDAVDGVGEEWPTAFAVCLGPEVRDELLATNTAAARLTRCENRQQGQTTALDRSAGEWTRRSFYGSSSEELELIHVMTGDELTTSGRRAGETRWPFCARLT